MSKNSTKLGDVPVDAVQSWRKTYCVDKDAHRVTDINQPYTKVCYAYTDCGRVSTITFTYDSVAEISTITTVADSAGSLCGTFFSIHSANDVTEYRPTFIVSCGSCLPASTCDVKYFAVNIATGDHEKVVALALKNAINANCLASVDISSSVVDEVVTTTNLKKGSTTDINDSGCTGFTFAVTTQGLSEVVEKYTYSYDCFNRLQSIVNLSGVNVMDMSSVITCSINRKDAKYNNSVAVVRTLVNSCVARKINFPECANCFIIYHNTCCKTLYYGNNSGITVCCTSAPLEQNERLKLELDKGNENNFFGISCSGCITVFVVGVYRE